MARSPARWGRSRRAMKRSPKGGGSWIAASIADGRERRERRAISIDLHQSAWGRGTTMRTLTKNQRPTKDAVDRLLVALMRGTGVRLSALDVKVLRPIIVEAV